MKLKKLLLAGFKSFADRTEFEFDEGISCVVGPNGCGKSNIVDAVKWVLGEQSAKSLRGSEMADVIFNGSAARRPSSMAEVTLAFDNSRGTLQPNVKADPAKATNGVVSVTRRLFRSGQSEYLINNTPCRRRDIREMFMDTGIGVDAYSLIEQGKVEVFLQASHDERRAIFDEAAGISKYKARKREALRKLDRVEQNLLRLHDILEEVDKRLRSIKYQAGKARSYQAYSQRLKELRSLHSLAQYHHMTRHRADLQARLDAANDNLSALATRIDQLEAARSATDVEAVDLERSARDLQGRIASVGGQILSCQERADLLAARAKELDQQVLTALARCEEMEAKLETATRQREQRADQLRQLQQQQTQLGEQYQAVREAHAAGELVIARLRARLEDEKAGTIDLFRRTAQLHNEIHGLGIRRESLHGQKVRLAGRADQIDDALRAALTDRAQLEAKRGDCEALLDESNARLEEARKDACRLHDGEQSLQVELSEARQRRSALLSRVETLREMQQRLEGVASGVRRVLEGVRAGKLRAVRGMLGEFLRTDVAHAPIVEAALAGADQQLLTDRLADLAAEAGALDEILGEHASVEVLCLDRLRPFRQDLDAACCPRVLGRVIDHVRFPAELAPLMWRLLGRTLVVRTLDDAVAAAAGTPDGFRFVTLAGDVLEPDGRVRFGAANRAAGLIARRSELTDLRDRRARLEQNIEQLELRCESTRNELRHLDEVQQGLRTAVYEANAERIECRSRIAQLDEQIAELKREQPVVAGDLDRLAAEIDATVRAERDAQQKAQELERLNEQREQQIRALEAEAADASGQQAAAAAKMTEMKVTLAALDEKQRAAREALQALGRQVDQMQAVLESDREQIALDRKRKADAEAASQAARAEVDRLYAEQQQFNQEAADLEESRRGLQEKLEEIRAQLSEKRKAHAEAGEQVNALKLELGEADVRIETLLSRAADEMHMDLLAGYEGYQHDEQRDWDAVEAEIADLRGKIERLGNVNLDAIVEQEELQKRREFLAGQLADVEDSRRQLNDLVRRINRESRELFTRTFDQVRKHFQELFRKLFGGGRADILLLDPDDVLESGIDIIARPPGKELRSLSLLSGGEKTMTALSLLFSFFRCRPSPFCLLDEVDAALDETNTERFSHLVGEFVANSQFLIISHAKRTMSMANVLYGVTMQEPGVSRRISVRFEDAGHKLEEQLEPVGA